jgi:hypothetical protein
MEIEKQLARRQQEDAPKTGRPTIFSNELADRICTELASGRSARSVCSDKGMPSMQTFWRWLREIATFREQYARAKQEAADALVEEMLDIADDATGDYAEDEQGRIRFNSENVQRSRLKIETRKWIASKLKPSKYGERLDLAHGVQPENPLAALIQACQGTSLKVRSDEELRSARIIDHEKQN